jgi:P-type Ca2+ transporter type 2C
MPDVPSVSLNWHVLQVSEVLAAVSTTDAGLSHEEATARLRRVGPNQLPQQPPPAWWWILVQQLLSPLIYLLIFAATPCSS